MRKMRKRDPEKMNPETNIRKVLYEQPEKHQFRPSGLDRSAQGHHQDPVEVGQVLWHSSKMPFTSKPQTERHARGKSGYAPRKNQPDTNKTNTSSGERNATMNIKCPKCGKEAYLKNYGRATGTVVGAAAGVASTTAGAAAGGKAGAIVGSFFGPAGTGIGAAAGTILGALGAAFGGGCAGHKVGELIDQDVIRKYHCPSCDHTFDL
jgi:predicted RNA-binding Zn-ribbon protein involved in translation (DUF1610 family)